jgi:2-polyprenyl-6-methoxyphenol hydroxylase-like FAD-dependent oxidoreductase
VYPEGRDYRAWDDGDRLYYTPLGARAEAQFGAPYYHAHRADLLDVLLGGVANTGFRLNARIEGFVQTADRVTVTLADGTKVTGDVLIGADGIHSTVRGQLFGKELPGGGAAALRSASPAAHRVDAGFIAPRGGTLPDDRCGCDRSPQCPHADQSHPGVGKLPARANAALRL